MASIKKSTRIFLLVFSICCIAHFSLNGGSNNLIESNLDEVVSTPVLNRVVDCPIDEGAGETLLDSECVLIESINNNFPPEDCDSGLDSDMDGISDVCDLDDDNDGILDIDEGACKTFFGSITVNTASGEIADYDIETATSTIICTGVGTAYDIAMSADGSVYYLLFPSGRIASVDPTTCNSTDLGDVGSGTFNSLSILPDGTLLAGNTSRAIKRFNIETMTTTDWADNSDGVGSSTGDFCLVDGFIYYASNSGLQRITVDTNYNFVSVETVGPLASGAYGMTLSANCQLIYGGNNSLRSIDDPNISSASTLITSNLPDFGSVYGLTSLNEQDGCLSNCEELNLHLDTDLDGIPDYLDLDSDNDGCPDALEGDALESQIGYAALNANTSISGGVDDNGVPNIAAGGQGVGTSIDSTLQVSECNPCNIDNPAFVDTDGDSIGDYCDLDDDNDGILDVDECFNNVFTIGNDGTFGEGTSQFGLELFNGETDYTYTSSPIQPGHYAIVKNSESVDYEECCNIDVFRTVKDRTQPDTGYFAFFDMGVDDRGSALFKQTIDVMEGVDYRISFWVAGPFIYTPNSVGIIGIQIDNVLFQNATINDDTDWVYYSYEFTATSNNVLFELINNSTGGTDGSDFAIDDIYIESLTCYTDTDGDGIVNSLDLDSDNDGCPDYVEGSASFTELADGMNLPSGSVLNDGNGDIVTTNLGILVDTDPTSPSYGVPLVAGIGQGLGTSIDAFTNACLPTSLNCGTPCPVENQLINGSFDTNTDEWTTNSVLQHDPSGPYGGFATINGSNEPGPFTVYQEYTIEENKEFIFEGYAARSGASQSANVYIEYYNGDTLISKTPDFNVKHIFYNSFETILPVVRITPPNTTKLRVVGWCSGTALMIDELSITICDPCIEICGNDTDDDSDGLIDEYDPDCSCISAGIPNISFDQDTNGQAIGAGTMVSETWSSWGVHISTTNLPSTNYLPMIFDSENPTLGNTDLGSPNSTFGGPGIGDGGQSGALGENSTALGNVLIISNNSLNNYENGGTMVFDFDVDVDIASLEILDFDNGNTDGSIRAYDNNNNLVGEKTIYAYGDNSYQKVNLSFTNIRKLEVVATNSFAIASLNFCDDDLPTSSIGDFVWLDINHDGLFLGENGIENIPVNLYSSTDDLLAETITDNTGYYSFENLTPGQYIVRIAPPSNYFPSGDLDNDDDNDSGIFTLAGNQNRGDLDFGLYLDCIPTISNDQAICEGESATITASGGVSYTWNNGLSNDTTHVVNPTSTTTYIVTVTTAAGCTDTASTTITVSPTLSVIIDYNGSACLEDDSELTAVITGGTGPFEFSWTTPDSTTASTQTISISQIGNYYVTVTDLYDCEASTTGFVYEAFEPSIFTLDTVVCDGESVVLEINDANILDYQWGSNAGSSTSSSVSVTPSVPSSTYLVTVTNNTGCTSTASATISVKELPVANAGNNVQICENEITSIGTVDLGDGSEYSWDFGSNATPSSANGVGPHNVSFVNSSLDGDDVTEVVTLTVTKDDCSNTDTKNVILRAEPKPTVTISHPSCGVDNGSITFTYDDNISRTTIEFSIDGGASYPYSANDNAGSFTINNLASGDYDLSTIWGNGQCPKDLGSITLNDNEIPTISITGENELCIGESALLSSSTGGTWTSDNEAIATIDSSGFVQAVSAGTATISFVAYNDCPADNTIVITVADAQDVTISGENTLCEQDTTTLTTSQNGGTWISTDTNIAIVNSSGVVTAISAGTVTIIYDHSSNACFNDSSFDLEIFELPTVNISGATTICLDGTSELSTNSIGGYWTSNDPSIATVSSNGLVSGIAVGSTSFYYTSANDCQSANTGLITVNSPVEVSVDVNGSQCLQDNSQLTAVVTGGTPGFEYNWSGPGGFFGDTETVSITQDGNYTVTITDSVGCMDVYTIHIYEAYEPFTFALNTAVCIGEQVTLTLDDNNTQEYQWGANAGNATSQSVTVTPGLPSTTYNVTVTNTNGCTSVATADIIVHPKPTVSIASSDDICVNETTQLLPNTGGTWSSSNNGVASVTNTGLVTGLSSGSAVFTFRSDLTGCLSDETSPVTVNPNATITISGLQDICMESTTTLTSSEENGLWSSTNTSVATINSSGDITPIAPGLTTIIFEDTSGGCFEDAEYDIEINTLPTITLNGPSTICEDDQTYAIASHSGTWNSSDESVATISTTGVITGISAGTTNISFTNNAGCESQFNSAITVVGKPIVSLTGPASICINETTTLSPTTGGIWISENNSVGTVSSTGIVTGVSQGTVSFTFIELINGCISDSTINVVVNGKPSINGLDDNDICIGETTNITPSTGGAWESTDDAIATIENDGTVTGISNGNVRFMFTNSITGCTSDLSAPLTVKPRPIVTFTGPTDICIGETTSITSIGAGQWSSSDVTVAIIDEAGNITGVGTGDVSFVFTNNSTGCSSDPSEILTIGDPTPIYIIGPSQICVGGITNLFPSTGGTWSSSNDNIATIDDSGQVEGITSGEVTFTFNSNVGCTSNASAPITIEALPIVSIEGSSSLCIGTTTNLSPNIGGAWTSSDTDVATVDANGIVTAIAAGFTQLTFEDALTGCSSVLESLLNVYGVPEISIVGQSEICIGGYSYMSPSTEGTWTSSNPNVATITNSGEVYGVSAGTAIFTYTENGSNCVTEASDPMEVLSKPIVSIVGDNTICVGANTTLSTALEGSWISDNPTVASVTDEGVVTGLSQGIVKFTFISNNGCESNKTPPVIVFGPPSVLIAGPTSICINDNLQMLPSSGGKWTSSDDDIATIDNSGLITSISEGTVRFTFVDTNTGCSSEESGIVSVEPTPEITINGPSDICIGGTTYMTPFSGGYWTSINPSIASIQNDGLVTGISAGQARFIFTNITTGCVSDTSSYVTVNNGPTISLDGPDELCIGENTQMLPSTEGTWTSTNPLIATIDDTGLVTAIASGVVKFRYTETSSGCQSDLSEPLIINGPPSVFVSGTLLVCIGSTTTLSPSTGGTWESLNESIATTTEMGVVTGVSEGTAYFVFTDALTGCESDGTLSIDVATEIDAEVTGDSEICTGYTTTLSPTSGGTWTSSNPAIASVSNSGVVTGRAPGIVTFTFVDSNTGCSSGGTTEPITVQNCINHDFNVALVNQTIAGNLNTNDIVPNNSTYSNIKITVEKPLASIPVLTINPDGTYSFSTNKAGKYLYKVSVCLPPAVSGCPSAYLEFNVIENVYGQSNPVSNLEFATTYANSDPSLAGNTITVNPYANDDCVYTVGCSLDISTMSIMKMPSNGSVVNLGDGSFDYTPNAGFIGHDSVEYEICVLGETKCSRSFQVITVNAPNALNTVIAADDFAYTLKGTEKTGNVADNDMDPEFDEMIVTQQGSLMNPVSISEGEYYINNDGSYSFTPNDDFSGSLDIVYTICDNNAETACANATIHIQVFDDLSLDLRVYLEGSLMSNGNKNSAEGHPLMRDGLRVSPHDDNNHIPMLDPYSNSNELFDDTANKFTKIGPGLIAKNLEIIDSTAVFSVTGDNAIVDWIFVELRDKNDNTNVIATRSGLLQRDGDIVDLDGTSNLRFQGINIDSFYVCVRHRTHLGVMSTKVSNGTPVDFTSPTTPTFNFGSSLANGKDYTGLSQKSTVKSGYMALWAGDFNSDGALKFTEPSSDINVLYGNVLFSSPQYLINYDFAYGYFKGDYNMDGKAKYANPNDDRNFLQGQVIFHPLNTSAISNLDGIIQQIPN